MEQFKKKLLQEKKKIKEEIKELRKQDPFFDSERLVDNKEDEDAREEVGHETIEAQINQLQSTLKDIELALEKIKKGTYGKCEICGRPISLERLKIAPAARFCVECQKKIE